MKPARASTLLLRGVLQAFKRLPAEVCQRLAQGATYSTVQPGQVAACGWAPSCSLACWPGACVMQGAVRPTLMPLLPCPDARPPWCCPLLQVLVEEDAPGDCMYVLVSGACHVRARGAAPGGARAQPSVAAAGARGAQLPALAARRLGTWSCPAGQAGRCTPGPPPPTAAGAGGALGRGFGSGPGSRRRTTLSGLSDLVQAVRSRRSTGSAAPEPEEPGLEPPPSARAAQGGHGLSEAQAAALPSIRAALELQELEARQEGGLFKHTTCATWGLPYAALG
jgi:hypothetical protein